MTIIVVPTERCSYKCAYCFEPSEQRKGLDIPYSFEAIKRGLYEVWSGPYRGSSVCLHGGECTMVPIAELEKLMDLIYNLPYGNEGKTLGAISMVTNGSNIDERLIALFKKYNVYVGVSMDGPPKSNLLRGPNPDDVGFTIQNNEVLMGKLRLLRDNNIPTSIMCIIHKMNAGDHERVERLLEWMLYLKSIGINGGRMNPMYSDRLNDLELNTEELVYVYKRIYEFNKRYNTSWNPLIEFEKTIRGGKPSPCCFTGCDLFNTKTISVLPDGRIGNCDRTFSRGIYERSLEGNKRSGRYEALRQTECSGCRFWDMCMGGCFEEGIGGDWRRKTRFCEAYKQIWTYLEEETRIKYSPIIKNISPVVDKQHSDQTHGDSNHGDSLHGDSIHGDSLHGDSLHGDVPHGDSTHGDAPDWKQTNKIRCPTCFMELVKVNGGHICENPLCPECEFYEGAEE